MQVQSIGTNKTILLLCFRFYYSFCKVQQGTYLPLQLGWNYIGTKINKITGGRLVNIFLRKKQKRTVMNLIRCEAHREVVVTILEESLR